MPDSTDSFALLSAVFAQINLPEAPAEFHGGLCASLCAGGTAGATDWIDQWCAEIDPASAADASIFRDSAEACVQSLWEAMNAAGFELQLGVPEASSPQIQIIDSLAQWCHGFNSGLGCSGLQRAGLDQAAQAQLDEIIHDFSEISRAELDEDGDEAGFQLEEIREFVRVGAQLVFELLAPLRKAERKRSLH